MLQNTLSKLNKLYHLCFALNFRLLNNLTKYQEEYLLYKPEISQFITLTIYLLSIKMIPLCDVVT